MTHMKRFRTMVCVLVAITLMVTLLCGSAVATSANDRSKIVRFRPITTSLLCLLGRCIDLKTSEGMEKALAEVAASGGRVLHRLPFINALAVEFAENESATVGVLTDLLSSLYVLEVVDDLQTWVDPYLSRPGATTHPRDLPLGTVADRDASGPSAAGHIAGAGIRGDGGRPGYGD